MSALPQPSSKTDAPTSCDATAIQSRSDDGAPESGCENEDSSMLTQLSANELLMRELQGFFPTPRE
jgi:hypothetical protein